MERVSGGGFKWLFRNFLTFVIITLADNFLGNYGSGVGGWREMEFRRNVGGHFFREI